MAASFPTPLPEDVTAETNRVIAARLSYMTAEDRLYKAKCRLYVRRTRESGKGGNWEWRSARPVHLIAAPNRSQRRGNPADQIAKLDACKTKAFADMVVSPLNWDVVGTDGLKNEIQNFVKRADTMSSAVK